MLFKIIDYLIQNVHKSDKKFLLTLFMRFGIPFNSSHPFQIIKLSKNSVCLKQKLSWFNKNHLRGMHACAITTIGELSAGLLLMKNFSPRKNRFIMKSLHCDYHYQGRTNLFSKAECLEEELEGYHHKLADSGEVDIKMLSELYDKDERHVATVETIWQLKSWNKIKTT